MLKKLSLLNKKIHKFIGLFIILFLIWNSVSGIILNHKSFFGEFTVPSFFVPNQYEHSNWNRGSMIKFIFLKDNPSTGFVCGKRGVYKTTDGGKTFEVFMKNYPESLLFKKTNDLILIKKDDKSYLIAGNLKGLFFCNLADGNWKRIVFSGNDFDEVKRIIKTERKIIVLTDSSVFTSKTENIPDFKFINTDIKKNENNTMTLIDYFRHIHSGNVWGLLGRLLFDLFGLIIIFLSVSAFYIWYFPLSLKKRKKDKTPSALKKKYFKIFFKYHKLIGLISVLFLIIIAVTAFFMRPPFIALIANSKISNKFYPTLSLPRPWENKIHNAVYIKESNTLLLDTSEGFYRGHLGKKETFKKTKFPLKVFVMGSTVFEKTEKGYLVGSFNGIYEIKGSNIIDYMSKKNISFVSSVIPGKYMITGYFKTPDGDEFITTHRKGVLYLNGKTAKDRFPMPRYLKDDNSISLWNYMFELHNGRIFKDLIGNFYILIIPLFSLMMFLVVISGVIYYITEIKRKKNKN